MQSVGLPQAQDHCWARRGWKKVYYKMYLGSITLMKTYTALFAAIGGRDGMDAGGVHQMMCAIYGTHQPSGAGHSHWAYFFIAIYIYICIGGWDVLEHKGMRVSKSEHFRTNIGTNTECSITRCLCNVWPHVQNKY
jgi:hypothetical protein